MGFEKLCAAAIIGFGGYVITSLPRLIRDYPVTDIRQILPNLFVALAGIAILT